ncbi:hypothetical protein Lal_00016973 [Lupinus albus]|nr:hypothetical protein Lal_00016973 [Lupinus albus]
MEPIVLSTPHPFSYESDKAVPWKYGGEGNEKVDVPTVPEIRPDGSPMDEMKYGHEISNEQASEFLKFIKESEYKVVDQLRRTHARIFILSLLMDSEPHRNVVLKILNQAHVILDITIDKLGDSYHNNHQKLLCA